MDRLQLDDSGARALHRFAVLSALVTFCLIFVGGLVTSTGSALAVPDWPLAFGKLIPAWKGGIRFEFGHRMVAGTVVILTLILMAWAWRAERRGWVRRLAYIAFGLVVFQAVLGGITVLFELPLAIAVSHAATAQAFFCIMVTLAMVTNPAWEGAERRHEAPARPSLAMLAGITTAIIYIQILIGALMRHIGAGLVIPDFPLSFGHIVPPYFNEYIAVNFAHRCGALVVTAMIVWTAVRVFTAHRGERPLVRAASLLLVLLACQITLGALTIWTGRAVIPTTAHVAIGAGVLATALALTLRASHLLTPARNRMVAHEIEAEHVAGHGVTA
jgi:heme a synthase